MPIVLIIGKRDKTFETIQAVLEVNPCETLGAISSEQSIYNNSEVEFYYLILYTAITKITSIFDNITLSKYRATPASSMVHLKVVNA